MVYGLNRYYTVGCVSHRHSRSMSVFYCVMSCSEGTRYIYNIILTSGGIHLFRSGYRQGSNKSHALLLGWHTKAALRPCALTAALSPHRRQPLAVRCLFFTCTPPCGPNIYINYSSRPRDAGSLLLQFLTIPGGSTRTN